jgi:hypothetical protein
MPLDDHPGSRAGEDHPEHSICEILYQDRVVGLGFAVGRGHVATCAHVVNSALGRADKRDPAWPGNAETISLRFAIGSAGLTTTVLVICLAPSTLLPATARVRSPAVADQLSTSRLRLAWASASACNRTSGARCGYASGHRTTRPTSNALPGSP